MPLQREGLQHFWFSEEQPIGNDQEVQPSAQSWCPSWIPEDLGMLDGWRAHCHILIAMTEECAFGNYFLRGVHQPLCVSLYLSSVDEF
jgi:hypothetical protein